MNIFLIRSAELTLRDGRVLTVPVNENISAFVPAFWPRALQQEPKPGSCPGYDLLVLIDGRVHRSVTKLVYIDPDGKRSETFDE